MAATIDRYDEIAVAEFEEIPITYREDEPKGDGHEYAASFTMPPVQSLLKWLYAKPQGEVVGAPADHQGCPIYNFLTSLGVPITSVGIYELEFRDGSQYRFTDETWGYIQGAWIEHCRQREGIDGFLIGDRLKEQTIMAREAYVLAM